MVKRKVKMELSESLNILVVGDWVVDENWIIANHDAETSAHVGNEHFRSLVDHVDSQVLSLCGAGNVARSLHGLSIQETPGTEEMEINKTLKVFGLGLWHPEDTKLLSSLFSNYKLKNQTPLTLSGLSPSEKTETGKYSLCGRPLEDGTCIYESKTTSKKPCEKTKTLCYHLRTLFGQNETFSCGTSRVIRLFKTSAGGDPEVLLRIDWQVPYQIQQNKSEINKISNSLWNEDINAIIVHDFNKGAINKEIINMLLGKYPQAEWFIRTKKIDRSWIEQIPENKFRLLFRN